MAYHLIIANNGNSLLLFLQLIMKYSMPYNSCISRGQRTPQKKTSWKKGMVCHVIPVKDMFCVTVTKE